ncbi:MAG: hypothetical protein JNM39_16625 [Bdellovibrionaceae bacterium]|nr:hypothetical protein [Pseudobdellovibrionaceae bacterium]
MKVVYRYFLDSFGLSFLFGFNPNHTETSFNEIERDKLAAGRIHKDVPSSNNTLIALTERMVRYQWQEKRVINAMPPIPFPREWSEVTPGNLGNSAIFPGYLTDALGRRLPLTTSTSPQWLFKKPGTNGQIVVPIGMTAMVEAYSTGSNSRSVDLSRFSKLNSCDLSSTP